MTILSIKAFQNPNKVIAKRATMMNKYSISFRRVCKKAFKIDKACLFSKFSN